jgi:uncharacterized repeat protein (TIGR01451 family)
MSATPSQGTYKSTSGVWTVGTVTPSVAQTLTITAQVVSPTAQTNTASISHSDQFDPVTTNNSASATETPQKADLALSKTVSNATPNVGTTIAYTVTLTNNGPDTATNISVTDLLPAGLNLISAVTSVGSYDSSTGLWTVANLAAAGKATLTFNAQVVSPSPQANTATITGADQFDPNTSNNSASATETPQRADLAHGHPRGRERRSAGGCNVRFCDAEPGRVQQCHGQLDRGHGGVRRQRQPADTGSGRQSSGPDEHGEHH